MSRKLAIAISGAVSLGSYEAGVMYEVLEAIAKHNEKLTENHPDRIEIDVITGASAGGMTAGILAQELLYNGQNLRLPNNNSLFNAWVQDVDIRELLTEHHPDNYKFSLLSSEVVDNIADKYLLDLTNLDTPNKQKKAQGRNAHLSAAKKIYMGVTMSNLNGWDYNISPRNTSGDGQFAYTRYRDRFVCELDDSNDNIEVKLTEISLDNNQWIPMRESNWAILRECSLSSGAFPFAFASRMIRREPGAGEFQNRVDQKYAYTDGGVFENEPLGLAKKLAEWIDHNDNSNMENNDELSRVYLYIAPGNKKSTANQTIGRNEPADLWNTLQALVAAIFHQSRFQDWIIKDTASPIFQVTTTDQELIGEVFSAFGGFLDVRFRFYDYNIGRESARESLIKFSEKNTNLNLVYWQTDEQIPNKNLSAEDWQIQPGVDGAAFKAEFGQLAQNGTLDGLLNTLDRKKRKVIFEQLVKRIDSLIDYFNEKLDTKDAKKDKKPFFNGVGRKNALKPIVSTIAKIFLWKKLSPWR